MKVADRYELADKLRTRYYRARKRDRGKILDAFCLATGYNRRHAMAVLSGAQKRRPLTVRLQRRRRYGRDFREALAVLWEASDYICAERLQPFMGELLALLVRHGQMSVSAELEVLLSSASVSTVERNLRPLRTEVISRRRQPKTRPGALLRRQVPVLVGDWKVLDRPGYTEIDLVSHSGEYAAGEWIYTLTLTDICTGWTERLPLLGKSQKAIVAALDLMRSRLPFDLKGIHSDNGFEFLNDHLIRYCQAHHIAFTRGRPNYKNDNPHVEQKNGTHVRRLIGYDRLDTPEQFDWLLSLYTDFLRPYNNLFQPVMKLVGREKTSSRTRKLYDRPRTPFARVLEYGISNPERLTPLVHTYTEVSPLTLKRQVDRKLAAMPPFAQVSAGA